MALHKGTMPVSTTLSSTRRYALGVLGVALLGVALLGVFVMWSSAAISDAIEMNLESRARNAAESYRYKLARAIRGRDATSLETWARLDPTLEEAFEGLPNLLGIVVRLPDGRTGAIIGPPDLRGLPFHPPPVSAGDMAVHVDDEGKDQPKAVASFVIPGGPEAHAAAQANVHLQFPPVAELRFTLVRQFQVGTVLVVVVIYLLALLAAFIGRQGTRAENREREKAVRLKAIGDVAGAIAHDLRNPLNAISLSFQVIGDALRKTGAVESSRERDLERAQGEVAKISKTVDNFVSFARLSDMKVEEFDVAEVAREALAGLSAACAEASVRPQIHVTGATGMRGDRDKIAQALNTTLQAVLDAVKGDSGTLDVEVSGRNQKIELRITGRGARVDSRRISNFAAARRAWDEPIGLGLTIARTWIDLHGGTVSGVEATSDRAELVIVVPKGFV